MPMIFSNSSAAWAATTRFTGAEETATAIWSRYSRAFWMMEYLAMVPARSF